MKKKWLFLMFLIPISAVAYPQFIYVFDFETRNAHGYGSGEGFDKPEDLFYKNQFHDMVITNSGLGLGNDPEWKNWNRVFFLENQQPGSGFSGFFVYAGGYGGVQTYIEINTYPQRSQEYTFDFATWDGNVLVTGWDKNGKVLFSQWYHGFGPPLDFGTQTFGVTGKVSIKGLKIRYVDRLRIESGSSQSVLIDNLRVSYPR